MAIPSFACSFKRQICCLRGALVFISCFGLTPKMAAEEPSDFNPKPLAGDFSLPMPDGLRMVFRPVYLNVGDGRLAEKEYWAGDKSGKHEKEAPTQVTVNGSFVDPKSKDWMFYIGKYEVTRAQFKAFPSEGSAVLEPGDARFPQTDVSESEVLKFISEYNLWLRKSKDSGLPSYDGALGMLRLPEEIEWEFAAKGGSAVSSEVFERTTPYSEGLNQHEWFAGSKSSHHKVKQIGILSPNPLGIFDLLGNVSEFTKTPYQLQIGKGKTGGITVRGGNFRTEESEIRSSHREEVNKYGSDGKETHLDTLGFRLVIASQVNTSQNQGEMRSLSMALTEGDRRARELASQMAADKGQDKASVQQKSSVPEGREAGQVYENSLASRFRWCPPGEFIMGSLSSEQAAVKPWWNASDEKQHPVKLTRGFWLAEHEVTQGEWKTVMGRSLRQEVVAMLNDEQKFNFGGEKFVTLREFIGASAGEAAEKHMGVEGEDMPVYWVGFAQAVEYCQRLTERERSAGRLAAGWKYTLPTEAQWEYACRAGTSGTVYSGGVQFLGKNNAPALDNIAWYAGNSSVNYTGRGWDAGAWTERQYRGATAGPRRVGTKGGNPWGLQDMMGNVFEWCADWYTVDITRGTLNPMGPPSGVFRVVRGGSWLGSAASCRAACRFKFRPGYRFYFSGFRPALVST